jgi:hypothetical protein
MKASLGDTSLFPSILLCSVWILGCIICQFFNADWSITLCLGGLRWTEKIVSGYFHKEAINVAPVVPVVVLWYNRLGLKVNNCIQNSLSLMISRWNTCSDRILIAHTKNREALLLSGEGGIFSCTSLSPIL